MPLHGGAEGRFEGAQAARVPAPLARGLRRGFGDIAEQREGDVCGEDVDG